MLHDDDDEVIAGEVDDLGDGGKDRISEDYSTDTGFFVHSFSSSSTNGNYQLHWSCGWILIWHFATFWRWILVCLDEGENSLTRAYSSSHAVR